MHILICIVYLVFGALHHENDDYPKDIAHEEGKCHIVSHRLQIRCDFSFMDLKHERG